MPFRGSTSTTYWKDTPGQTQNSPLDPSGRAKEMTDGRRFSDVTLCLSDQHHCSDLQVNLNKHVGVLPKQGLFCGGDVPKTSGTGKTCFGLSSLQTVSGFGPVQAHPAPHGDSSML
ncbi:hypothetical protein CRENBAI_012281 [Crenichthys baileyi]|uniref:Uncharacterized protein n=1 Tax=Crenichthys baileyi TaxID=28760 RepID=A0AAV9S7E4_9TELE